jgi:disulfide bond formation protein DsbB
LSILALYSLYLYTKKHMNIYLFERILGIAVLGLQIILLGLVIYLLYKKITKKRIAWLENYISNNNMWLVGFISLGAIIGSLIFSDYYNIEPCKLCWIQRIFIYPQALIMFIAAYKKDIQAWTYSLWLSIIGLAIALYQSNEQLGITNIVPKADCVADASSACAQVHMLEFGYITFPLASATLFLAIIILYFLRKK